MVIGIERMMVYKTINDINSVVVIYEWTQWNDECKKIIENFVDEGNVITLGGFVYWCEWSLWFNCNMWIN